jgi:hypothetical protein
MTEGFYSIITQLEGQRAAIDKALAALRDVNGTESSAAEGALDTKLIPSAHVVRKGRMSPAGKKRLISAVKKRWARKKAAGNPPVVSARATRPRNAAQGKGGPTEQGRSKELKKGTMKARTVELLQKAARPMQSGEVAKRMKIGSGHASVNLSQLRRDGFLTHTPEGYIVG